MLLGRASPPHLKGPLLTRVGPYRCTGQEARSQLWEAGSLKEGGRTQHLLLA